MLTAMLGTRRKGRRKGISIREGSVAQARSEAGLTLAQVAGGKVSRTAIHLVETGRMRPSMETLKQIALQTRKPMNFFVGAVDRPSMFTERTLLQKAKLYLEEALAAGEATREPSVQAKVCMIVGEVEEWSGNILRADEQFETAIGILSRLGTPEPLRDAYMRYAEQLDARQDIAKAARNWKLAAEIGKLAALGLKLRASSEENAESRAI